VLKVVSGHSTTAACFELSFMRHSTNDRTESAGGGGGGGGGQVDLFLYAGARRSAEGIIGVVYLAQDVTRRQEAEHFNQVPRR
jgi:hypothetical protein